MIELKDIHKSFGRVQALQGVDLKAEPGTIHGIVGENGAGKSTLMKIMTGFISKTKGTILYNSTEIECNNPGDAARIGIGMLYQEPLDFPQLSVIDNFMAGAADFSPPRQRATLAGLCNNFGFNIHPDSTLDELTVGERQQLELMRLIRNKTRILILDEPTAGISKKQQKLLFTALQTLKNDGATILLVSHKLDEVTMLCDSVTVLRRGKVAGEQKRPFNRDNLLKAMFDILPEHQAPIAKDNNTSSPVLEFKQLCSTVGRSGLKDISITIHGGEIVGMAGVDGSGQSVFLKTAIGLLRPEAGLVRRLGRPVNISFGKDSRKSVFLPADRLAEGLFPGLSVREHHILTSGNHLFLSARSGLKRSEQAINTYSIRGTPDTIIEDLSGGNQQRLLLSLIPEKVKLILMENPTRGLDVQSAFWTWKHLHKRLTNDAAIVFASPDLEEIMEQATRVLVFYNGEIVLDKATAKTSYQEISGAITGQISPAPHNPDFAKNSDY